MCSGSAARDRRHRAERPAQRLLAGRRAEPASSEHDLHGPSLPAACRGCVERDTCGGGYLPHRYSRDRGFDNPSVWCADLLRLFGHIRGRMAVDPAETAMRRQVLRELAQEPVNQVGASDSTASLERRTTVMIDSMSGVLTWMEDEEVPSPQFHAFGRHLPRRSGRLLGRSDRGRPRPRVRSGPSSRPCPTGRSCRSSRPPRPAIVSCMSARARRARPAISSPVRCGPRWRVKGG